MTNQELCDAAVVAARLAPASEVLVIVHERGDAYRIGRTVGTGEGGLTLAVVPMAVPPEEKPLKRLLLRFLACGLLTGYLFMIGATWRATDTWSFGMPNTRTYAPNKAGDVVKYYVTRGAICVSWPVYWGVRLSEMPVHPKEDPEL